jgi:hypothetical protein
MAIENVALVNNLGQVVNHVIVDTDDKETMDALHEVWGTHRHVVTTSEDIIKFEESSDLWTTHCNDPDCDKNGFNLPDYPAIEDPEPSYKKIKIGENIYPSDSLLFKENAHNRPIGWVVPEDAEEMSISDGEQIN